MIQKILRISNNHGVRTLAKEFPPFFHKTIDNITLPLTNYFFDQKYGKGESIMSKEWDNLLLFDACRYDYFRRISPFQKNIVERRVTLGSRTPQFYHRTFDNKTCHDIVCVTANPQTLRYDFERDNSPFHAIISVVDQWDERLQTVHPMDVYEASARAEKKYPNKRLLIHFLQPHAPFIGPTAKQLRKRTGKTIGGLDPGREYTDMKTKKIDTTSYRGMLRHDPKLDLSTIRESYIETLRIVTNYVIGLAGKLKGKTAISSDHGELLGDRIHRFGSRRWEHPGGVRSKELCLVPWVEIPTDEKKTITSDPPTNNTNNVDQSMINEKLQSLGYME